jgi:arginyl-tRNA synthetase
MNYKSQIQKILHDYCRYLDLKGVNWSPDQPHNLEFGHYAVPFFQIAKMQEKNLEYLFLDFKNWLEKQEIDFLDRVENLKGFVNFYIKKDYWVKYVLGRIKTNNLIEHPENDLKVMLEFSSPNPGKSFHVGHLRNTLIGQSVANLYSAQGFKISTANYLNDTGLHIAKLVWYIQTYNKSPEGDIEKWLGKIYAEVFKLMEEDSNIEIEVKKIYQKIEDGDEAVWVIVNKIKKWSLDNFDEIYAELGIHFDHYFYDSEMIEMGKEYVEELLSKGIAQHDDGAVIVNLEKDNLTNALILKSDGALLYITKDLALARKRFDLYDINKLIYVVGVEQKLHFKQVFKILEKAGFKEAKNCEHLSYELLQLKEGKMGSRYGNVVTYRDLRDEVYAVSLEEVKNRYEDENEAWQRDLALKISLGAIKLWILKYDNNKQITFDIKQALDFAGDTGPYVLYTVARLNSLLKKSNIEELLKVEKVQFNLNEDVERELLRKLNSFAYIVNSARKDGRPSLVANYVLDLAKLINNYYHAFNILKEENQEIKESRLLLMWSARRVLDNGLSLLTINSVEKM